jgi:ribosome-associated translation inhibitor RaiA
MEKELKMSQSNNRKYTRLKDQIEKEAFDMKLTASELSAFKNSVKEDDLQTALDVLVQHLEDQLNSVQDLYDVYEEVVEDKKEVKVEIA